MHFTEIISINPEIRFGKPCLTGTRISVSDVLGWLASGMSYDEIMADYPGTTKEQILACLEYTAHREEKIKIST